ncbi:MAG TPA: hypothetical protein VG942_02420 [Hyphomonadaceae bacterium]|nr:hypothetical protein [Hyphomonadaceae bacterium]
MVRYSVAAALALVLAACSGGSTTPAASAAAGGGGANNMGAATMADFKTANPVKEVMGHAVDYNAFGVWNRQGWLIDAEGEHELFPTTDAEWLNGESAALALAEISNVLLLPNRPKDDKRAWVDDAHALYDAAMKAKAAAEKKDKQAFFDAGGDIYEACTQCHNRYVIGDTPGPIGHLPAIPPNLLKPTK